MKKNILLVTLLFLLGIHISSYAAEGFVVTAKDKGDLQTLLDEHNHIKLESLEDYRTNGLSALWMSSGQTIEGGYGTKVPDIYIPASVSNVTIDGIVGGHWTVPAIQFTGTDRNGNAPVGDPVNYNITLVGGVNGPGTNPSIKVMPDAKVEELKTTYVGGVDADLSSGTGYIRNSVFQAVAARLPGIRIRMKGNNIMPSYGNSIVGYNSTTPGGAADISRLGDINLIAVDSEGWKCFSKSHQEDQVRAFIFSDMDAVRMVGPSGGAHCPEAGAMLDISNTKDVVTWFDRAQGSGADIDDEYLDGVETYIYTQGGRAVTRNFTNNPVDQVIAEILTINTSDGLIINDTALGNMDLTTPENVSLSNQLFQAYTAGAKKTASVEKPTRRNVGVLRGSWDKDLGSKYDSTPELQAQIDQHQIIKLSAGIYYLGSPLKIGSRGHVEGIVGDAKDEVFLVSKGDFPVIQGRGDYVGGEGVSIVLEDLSIYGGSYGLDYSNQTGNFGEKGQLRFSSFRNIDFVGQSLAGANFSHIYGIDNNVWYRVGFRDMPIALKGKGIRADGSGKEFNYADKQYFIDNQYQDISDTVWHWESIRGSNSNAWYDSYFKNVGRVSATTGATGLLWVNNSFHNITGSVAIDSIDSGGSSKSQYFTQVDCEWSGIGPSVVTDTQAGYVGSLFIDTKFKQEGGSIVSETGIQTLHVWNSEIIGSATTGNVHFGTFVNSLMGQYSDKLMYFNGSPTTILKETAAPVRQILAR